MMIPNWIDTHAVKRAKVEDEYENLRRKENDQGIERNTKYEICMKDE